MFCHPYSMEGRSCTLRLKKGAFCTRHLTIRATRLPFRSMWACMAGVDAFSSPCLPQASRACTYSCGKESRCRREVLGEPAEGWITATQDSLERVDLVWSTRNGTLSHPCSRCYSFTIVDLPGAGSHAPPRLVRVRALRDVEVPPPQARAGERHVQGAQRTPRSPRNRRDSPVDVAFLTKD